MSIRKPKVEIRLTISKLERSEDLLLEPKRNLVRVQHQKKRKKNQRVLESLLRIVNKYLPRRRKKMEQPKKNQKRKRRKLSRHQR